MRAMRSIVFLVLMLGGSGAAVAADWSVDVGVESFRWREFDAGARLLEETGPRLRVGATWRQPLDVESRDRFQLRGALYLGRINYDGQSQDLLTGATAPFKTDADYAGVVVEAMYARYVGAENGGELFVGGGTDDWRRDIKGSGNVSGAIEDWTVIYLLAGGGANWNHPDTRQHLQAGVKYPIYTTNFSDSFNITLEPKGRASLFARLGTDFIRTGRARWGLDLYYDSYRFAASDAKPFGTGFVFQPQSKQDVIGVSATVYLQ